MTLPFASCDATPSCTGGNREWDVIQSGCALPAAQHAIGGVLFHGSPRTTAVVVSRGLQQIGTGIFTPAYRSFQPNGPGCGDPCYNAPSVDLIVQQP